MNTDEPVIVQLYFDRNEKAITETREKYGAYCNQVAYGILRDSEDASECENDTYFRLWNLIPPQISVCFRTFLGRIVRTLSLDRMKYRSAQKRSVVPEVLGELDGMLRSCPGPEQEVIGEELRIAVSRFLDAQTEQSRIFFVQRYW